MPGVPSVGGDAGLLDHLGPQRDVGLDDVGERLQRRALGLAAGHVELLLTSAVASAASSALLICSTTGCGVPSGTTTPNHGVTWASAKPCSAMVGTSGKYFERPSLMAPMIRIAPVCTCASAWLADRKVELIRPLAISGTICG